jgi:hypothetical protein
MNIIARYLIILMFGVAAVQAVHRVVHLAVGTDEITFIEDVQRPGHQRMFFTRETPTPENPQHHFSKQFLAALLAEPCVRLLPINEVTAARLPALLGLVLYLWGVWRIKDSFHPGWQQVLVVAALVANAFLLDFFSVARGYGLAMGCTALSLSYLMGADAVPGHARWALGWAAVAMLSCLAFLYFYAAVCAALWWMKWRKAPGLIDFGWAWSAVFSVVTFAVFCLPRILYSMRAPYILEQGGYVVRDGFFGETLLPLLNCCLYGAWWAAAPEASSVTLTPWSEATLFAGGWIVVGLVAGLGVYSWRHKNRPSQMLVGVMVAVFGLLELAHGADNIQFLRERTALFFLPLFVLLIATVAAQSRSRWLWGLLITMPAAGMAGYSVNYTYTWRRSADMPAVLRQLQQIHATTGQAMQLALSDGAKWAVWYYADRQLGLHLKPTSAATGAYVKTYGWLTIYEWRGCLHYLVDASNNWLLPGTTHLLLDDDDARLLARFPTGTVSQLGVYPASGSRLFALSAPEYRGALQFPNGAVYQGEVRDGQLNGPGTLQLPSGKTFAGMFVDDHMQGAGTLTLPEGTTYMVQFTNGLPILTTLTGLDGRVYAGEFQDANLRVFQGTATWPDGRKYVGQFRDGKLDGAGKMTYPGGKVQEGVWHSDEFLGSPLQ